MRLIPLLSIPNQSFTFNFGGFRYDFTIRYNKSFMTYDLSIDEKEIIKGFRFALGQMLIPYKYLESDGNFILSSSDGKEADYVFFGDTQNLYYLSSSEAEELRNVI